MTGQPIDLIKGLAADLDTAGAGRYLPTGTYAASDTAIVLKRMPDGPDKAIVLTAYVIDAYPDGAVRQLRLQVRSRGDRNDPTGPDGIDAATADFLNGLTGRTYGTCTVNDITFYSSVPLGPDGEDRWEISTNWTVDTSDPTRE